MAYAFDRPPIAGDVLDCGDVYPGTAPGHVGGTGYAWRTDAEGGDVKAVCYAHSDEMERADFAESVRYLAYVDNGGNLTTWTGGRLADAVPGLGEISRTGWHGSPIYSWRFVGPDGSRWYGRNGGPGMAILARRNKSQ